MSSASDPTVEEILESIKQVIARDNRVSAAEVRRQRETDGVVGDNADEDPDSEGIASEDVLDLSATAEYLSEDLVEDEDEVDYADERRDGPLLKAHAEAGIRESLAALALLSEPGAQPQIVRSGETSLEGLVRDLLRPALADWLERNLPSLVERLVAEEIKRISGKRG